MLDEQVMTELGEAVLAFSQAEERLTVVGDIQAGEEAAVQLRAGMSMRRARDRIGSVLRNHPEVVAAALIGNAKRIETLERDVITITQALSTIDSKVNRHTHSDSSL
jgi:hypothetical protein